MNLFYYQIIFQLPLFSMKMQNFKLVANCKERNLKQCLPIKQSWLMLLLFVTMINNQHNHTNQQQLNFKFLLKQAYLYIMIYIFRCLANQLTLSSVMTSSLGSSLIPDGGKVACSVTYPDGKVLVCGDSQMGLDAFTKKLKEKKRSSMDWVIPSEKFWPRRLACAMRACVRHAQLGHCYYHRSVFSSSFFLRLLL